MKSRLVATGLLVFACLAAVPRVHADFMPTDRRTTWNPGIAGGIPTRKTVCATVNASTFLNGVLDAKAGIQAVVDLCPAGQVVQLSAGEFRIDGDDPIFINKGITLRGAGANATHLRKTEDLQNPVVLIGERFFNLDGDGSANLTANGVKGATSVQVASTAGFAVGQLVLVDETTDTSYVSWGTDPDVGPGQPGRGWFTRYDRPVGQMMEITGIAGNTVSFNTPLHMGVDTAHAAQLTRFANPAVKFGGVEDMHVYGGKDGNIQLSYTMYSWVKNVHSEYSKGESVGLTSCFRCTVRDSYFHDTPNPQPGGDGYMLSVARYSSDNLIEDNIFMNGNKVMVMRASGGGNVIAYNYFDNGYIGDYLEWVETGINASHLTCPHFELFEGNQAFNIDGDDTFGGAMDITYFRNQATSHRRDFPDQDNRRAIGLMYYHYNYSFVGNVLGYAGMSPAPYPSFDYEDFFPWEQGGDFNAPVALWRIGYTPLDWNATPDPRVLSSIHRHANYDYVTNSVELKPGFDTTLPKSMYLTLKPWFMADSPWPWIDAQGTTKVNTLPARARFDAGQPVDLDLIFADNFQSSDLSAWGASATGAGKLTVSSQAGMASTTLGLRAAVSDSTPLYVEDDWPQDEDQFRARFYFNPSGFDPGEAQGHLRTRIFLVFEENPLRRLSAVVLKRQGGAFSLLQRCRLDDGSFADGTFVPITNAAHSIEISWKRSSTPTANDGACQMYVDNVLVSSRSGLDNNVSSVDFVRMGALSVKGGASGVLMWDQYWSRRKTLIGP